jgi:hypothetical protein
LGGGRVPAQQGDSLCGDTASALVNPRSPKARFLPQNRIQPAQRLPNRCTHGAGRLPWQVPQAKDRNHKMCSLDSTTQGATEVSRQAPATRSTPVSHSRPAARLAPAGTSRHPSPNLRSPRGAAAGPCPLCSSPTRARLQFGTVTGCGWKRRRGCLTRKVGSGRGSAGGCR